MLETFAPQKPDSLVHNVKIGVSFGIGTLALIGGLSGTVPDKGTVKSFLLLTSAGMYGYATVAALKAAQESEEWEIQYGTFLNTLEQVSEIDRERYIEAHSVLKEQEILQSIGGSIQALPLSSEPATVPLETSQVSEPATVPLETSQVSEPVTAPKDTNQSLEAGRYVWVKEWKNSSDILLSGGQGCGKTSKKNYLIRYYESLPDTTVWVLDSHAAFNQYQGYEPFSKYQNSTFDELKTKKLIAGGGMAWDEIIAAIEMFNTAIAERYNKRATEPYEPLNDTRVVLICEEMQNWCSRIPEDILKEFAGNVLTSTRKANMGTVIISQSPKATAFFGNAARGNADLIYRSFARLEGIPMSDPNDPAIKYPGKKAYWKPSGADKEMQVDHPTWLK